MASRPWVPHARFIYATLRPQTSFVGNHALVVNDVRLEEIIEQAMSAVFQKDAFITVFVDRTPRQPSCSCTLVKNIAAARRGKHKSTIGQPAPRSNSRSWDKS